MHIAEGYKARKARLQEELTDTDENERVAAQDIRDLLGGAAHHPLRALDALDVEVLIAAWYVCNADLGS